MIRRIKEMRFFSLDDTQYQLKRADWLRFVCWQPAVAEILKTQNHRLTSLAENPIDSLLLSAFEFIDVQEAGAANKILEDAATTHVRKVKAYFTELSKKTSKQVHGDELATIEAILRQAALDESMGSVGGQVD